MSTLTVPCPGCVRVVSSIFTVDIKRKCLSFQCRVQVVQVVQVKYRYADSVEHYRFTYIVTFYTVLSGRSNNEGINPDTWAHRWSDKHLRKINPDTDTDTDLDIHATQ